MPITFTAFVQHISEMANPVRLHTMQHTIAKLSSCTKPQLNSIIKNGQIFC